jgi:hypothetical protein
VAVGVLDEPGTTDVTRVAAMTPAIFGHPLRGGHLFGPRRALSRK